LEQIPPFLRWRAHWHAAGADWLVHKEDEMKNLFLAGAVCCALGVAGCSETERGAAIGGVVGAAAGGIATSSVGGAIVGAGVGALAGAILVESGKDWCTYRYHGRLYRERCR
jgi:hypothetical protein